MSVYWNHFNDTSSLALFGQGDVDDKDTIQLSIPNFVFRFTVCHGIKSISVMNKTISAVEITIAPSVDFIREGFIPADSNGMIGWYECKRRVTVIGVPGSYAEEYAIKNNMSFVPICSESIPYCILNGSRITHLQHYQSSGTMALKKAYWSKNQYGWMIAHEFIYACDRYNADVTGCGTAVPDCFPEISESELADYINDQEFGGPHMGGKTAYFCVEPESLTRLINIAKLFNGYSVPVCKHPDKLETELETVEVSKMIRAAVFLSETGHTKRYAELLAERTGLPVYDMNTAIKEVPKEAEVIYLGWLMAGTVKGYKKALKHFTVKAVCGVGMSGGNSQIADIRKRNHIPEEIPVFYLQGGFEMEKLHGIYKLMMQTMKKTVGKGLNGKENRTAEEDDMLKLLLHGGNRVSVDNLSEVLNWYKQNK